VEERRKLIRSHVMRGKNHKKRPSRPQSWINNSEANDEYKANEENAFSVPVKMGGEFSFTAVSLEISPDMLETIGQCK
jgi:hypothetical protein